MLKPRILPLPRPCLHRTFPQSNSTRPNWSTSSLRLLKPCTPTSFTLTRHASHAAQGRANGAADSAGKRLGAKRGASEYVTPGTIIFRQRGTKWFPGENVGMGRDHTIYALQPGWVRYYRDPARDRREGRATLAERGQGRRYIGVSLVKEGRESILPRPLNAASVRRLGMYAKPIATPEPETETTARLAGVAGKNVMSVKELGQWEPMAELVRRAEENQVKTRPFDRRDRWYAWRVRTKKIKATRLLRAATSATKKKKPPRKFATS